MLPCSVHQGQGVALNPPYTMEAMQCYIKYARAIRPRITQQVREGEPRCAFGTWVAGGVPRPVNWSTPQPSVAHNPATPRLSARKPISLLLTLCRPASAAAFHCLQARRQLVVSYRKLRGDAAAPGSATAYRITVCSCGVCLNM